MTTISRASVSDAKIIKDIGTTSFLESHGMSASKEDIDAYVNLKFNEATFTKELSDPENYFFIIHHNDQPVGYSKIIFNFSHENINIENVTKLERLYVLKEFHNLKLGLELFNYNVKQSKNHNQNGIWLFVWTENIKAFNFYQKQGFQIIGMHQFKISETHYNPNYQMLLTY